MSVRNTSCEKSCNWVSIVRYLCSAASFPETEKFINVPLSVAILTLDRDRRTGGLAVDPAHRL